MYVISYDIARTKLRNKVAKTLANYGKRIQYSVFECNMDAVVFRKCYAELVELTDGEKEVSIRCYYIDKTCLQRMEILGDPGYVRLLDDEEVIVV